MADLTWSGLTICDESEGDVYSRQTPRIGDVIVKDIAFPHSQGRSAMIVSNQTTEATSLTIAISGVIYRDDRAAAQALIDSVQSARCDASTLIGSLSFLDGTFANMRLSQFATGPIKACLHRNSERVFVTFTATFGQYAT